MRDAIWDRAAAEIVIHTRRRETRPDQRQVTQNSKQLAIGRSSVSRLIASDRERKEILIERLLGLRRRIPDTTLRDLLCKLRPQTLRPLLRQVTRDAYRRKALAPRGLPFGVVALDGNASLPTQVCDDGVCAGHLVNIRALATGYYDSLALDMTGTVWAWGRNKYGQVGDGT